MNANPKFISAEARVDAAAVAPLPNSRKIYVTGSQPDIRVPMREITQSDTPSAFGGEKNPPIYVYDTSGPYTDPEAKIDIRQGLPALRQRWIEARGDTEALPGLTSAFGRERAAAAVEPGFFALEETAVDHLVEVERARIARQLAALLDDGHSQTSSGELVGGRRASCAGADDDGIESR